MLTFSYNICLQEYLMNLFENYVDNGLNFARKKCVQAMQQVNWAKISLLDWPHWNTG